MTRRVSKSGTTYTEGSKTTLAGWEPKTCTGCGERVYVSSTKDTRASLYIHPDNGDPPQSWHVECWLKRGPPR